MSDQATIKVDRQAVRAWVQNQRAALEGAQAQGKLARVKLDMKDAMETAFPEVAELHRARLIEVFEEELDAFCSDLRLAGITIQQQVERVEKKPSGCAVTMGVIGILLAGLILMVFFGGNSSNITGVIALATVGIATWYGLKK